MLEFQYLWRLSLWAKLEFVESVSISKFRNTCGICNTSGFRLFKFYSCAILRNAIDVFLLHNLKHLISLSLTTSDDTLFFHLDYLLCHIETIIEMSMEIFFIQLLFTCRMQFLHKCRLLRRSAF